MSLRAQPGPSGPLRSLLPLRALCLLLLLPACSGEETPRTEEAEGPPTPSSDSASFPLEVVDAAGRTHLFRAPPGRIVSLVPSATQILMELGARSRLVARTDWDTVSALASLPSVGGGLGPSLERLVSLDPDLVIRFEGESDRVTALRLGELGIRHFAVRPEGMEDVRKVMEDLARIVGRPGLGDSLVAAMDGRLDELRRRVEGRSRPTVAYLLGGSPPMVAGPGTFIDELIRVAGGRNAFHDLGSAYAPVSPEELVARDIDVILHPSRAPLDRLEGGARTAVVSSLVETPGPGLARAAEEIARVLHPEAFR